MFHLPHFLHLSFWGLGEKHRPYTLQVNGDNRTLLKENGETEADKNVLDVLESYIGTLEQPLADGSYALDYDVAENEFHGLGTRHTKYRLVRNGDDGYSLYDADGEEVVDDSGAMIALGEIIDSLTDEQFMAIPEEDGFQIDYDESTGEFRGFGGGDSGGGGASGDFGEAEEPQPGITIDPNPEPQQGVTLAPDDSAPAANTMAAAAEIPEQAGTGADNTGVAGDGADEGEEDQATENTGAQPDESAPAEEEGGNETVDGTQPGSTETEESEPQPEQEPEPATEPEPAAAESEQAEEPAAEPEPESSGGGDDNSGSNE